MQRSRSESPSGYLAPRRSLKLRRLRRRDLPLDATQLAQFLIGCAIVSDLAPRRVVARITETEAYLPGDAAAHSFRGQTRRNASLFLRRGHAYVYFIYGNHYCLNVSGADAGVGAGVLLRAAEPLEGIECVRQRRGLVADRDLLRGPGRLAQGLGVTLAEDGADLTASGPLWLAAPFGAPAKIGRSVRIGISKEADRPLRFFELGSAHLSGPKILNGGCHRPF